MKNIDIEKIKKDFPILNVKPHGKKLIYLDNAATTQKPISVIKAMDKYYEELNANVYRSPHYLSALSTQAYEEARERVKKFINAKSVESIIFTRNTTESINFIAYTWGMKYINEGDEIILTIAEHHSNMLPWQMVAEAKKARLKYVYLDEDFRFSMKDFKEKMSDKVKLVAVQHMSNVLGIINPVEEITHIAHKYGAKVLIDGAQSVPHMPVDVQKIDCDFFAFSGHKMLGPMGIGVLYIKEDLLSDVPPFLRGGEMIDEVFEDRATFSPPPLKFEAGTPNVKGAYVLVSAIDYIEKIGLSNIYHHESELLEYGLQKMKELDFVKLYGPKDAEERGGIISFNVEGVHPHDVATILDEEGIAVRSGHHCCQPLMRYLGVPATVRASFYLYNDFDDIDALVEGLKKVRKWFK
ncbi:cysteine desulfurase, SufS subfamily [Thermoanaerobacter italicus Ab9]|jgi:cysteine desulfurase/selenocysteine lyase|uniref:Cysteine desulfurase n=1 Tax=Thermoanaerobacter italicus (strain DSM 9252 / Ab9) TaxID=580331 RepID=D3T6A6_THEIA|nr:cysteine desulfurase [Thermoanaerobacter italicus]ADD03500.1 cysteine desulfurase, SufS subfamily [Thermoanaerobacter italicus Ab9]